MQTNLPFIDIEVPLSPDKTLKSVTDTKGRTLLRQRHRQHLWLRAR